jgi:hypothetical protein
MTSTSADPSPSGGVDKVGEAVSSRVLKILEVTTVSPDLTRPGHDGANGSSSSAPVDYEKIAAELGKLTFAHIRRKRRQVQQASAASFVGTILLWAGLIIGIVFEVGLMAWLGWDATHPLSHPDLIPPLASTVANGASSGAAAFLLRRFSIGKASRNATPRTVSEAVSETLSDL